MLNRYRVWIEANPLLGWAFSIAISLAFCLIIFFAVPGPRTPGFALLLLCLVLSPPTHNLIQRFSDEKRQGRPIPAAQEKGVGFLSVLAFLCSTGAFGAAVLGVRWGWSSAKEVVLLAMFSAAALLSLGLGYAARSTATGRWGLRLTLGWLALMLSVALAAWLRRALMLA